MPTLNLSLQNGEETKWGEFDGEMTKLAMYNARGQSPIDFFFFFFPYGFLGVNIASFFLKKILFLFPGRGALCVCVCFFFLFN